MPWQQWLITLNCCPAERKSAEWQGHQPHAEALMLAPILSESLIRRVLQEQ